MLGVWMDTSRVFVCVSERETERVRKEFAWMDVDGFVGHGNTWYVVMCVRSLHESHSQKTKKI